MLETAGTNGEELIWDGSGGNAMKSAVVRLCSMQHHLRTAADLLQTVLNSAKKRKILHTLRKIFYSKCDMMGNRKTRKII